MTVDEHISAASPAKVVIPPPANRLPSAEDGVPVASVAPRSSKRSFRTAPAVGRARALRLPTLRWFKDIRLPDALENVSFRRYWLSQIVALAGTWMQQVGIQLVVLSLTTSALAIGMINVVSALPMLLFSLSGGVVADRFDRRHILIVTMSILGIFSLIYAGLIGSGRIEYWHILVLAAGAGTVMSFQMPAGQAFVSDLVPRDDLPEAMALNSAAFNSTRIIGPALAASAISILGLASAFIVNAVTILAPIGTLVRLGKVMTRPPRVRNPGSQLHALMDGLRYVRSNDAMLGLILLQAAMSFFASPNLLVLLPLYITDQLGGAERWVGIMLSLMGVGSLIGSLVMLRGSRLESAAARRLMVGAAGLSLGMAWLAFSQSPMMAVPGVLLAGYSFASGNTQIMTRLQQTAREDFRGRVMSLSSLAFNGVMPFSTLVISGLAQVIGLHIVMGTSGALLALCGLYLWRRYVWKAFLPEATAGAGVQPVV